MELSQLQNISRVTRAAEAKDSAPRAEGTRVCRRFTSDELDWLQVNHAEYTAAEAGERLERPAATVRKKCLSMGLQLKYSDCSHANNTKPGKQKALAGAV